MLLSYSYTPGGDVVYDFDMTLDMVMKMKGGEGFGGAVGPTEMAMSMTGTSKYGVSEGPDPGTTRIALSQTLDDISLGRFMVDGESMLGQVDDALAQELAAEQGALPEMTVILDERGNIISFELDGEAVAAGLFGGSNMGSMDPTGGVMGIDGFFGPAFPEEKLAVGDEWTVTDSLDVPYFNQSIDVESKYRIVREEELNGRNVLVIESTTDMSDITIDLMEMMESLADGDLAQLEALGMSEADFWSEFAAIPAGLEMRIDLQPGEITETVWFDPGSGLMVKSEGELAINMGMAMNMFGEDFEVDIRMLIDIDLDLRAIADGTPA